jgi:lipopolysaccharide/colanic/teichoic acid biosynthesis glycosyltransferase
MIQPIFIDARPEYIRVDDGPSSLLLAPVGTTRLVSLLRASFLRAGDRTVVLPTFNPCSRYMAAMRVACEQVDVVPLSEFRTDSYEASDWLLFIDPRFYCADALRLPAMLKDTVRPSARATHLVAMTRHTGGTNERVELAANGQVRRIQRYYDAATWPVLSGVACSLVSVACLRTTTEPLRFASLTDLRAQLTSRGVPSRDVLIEGAAFELGREDELVRLNERAVIELLQTTTSASPHLGRAVTVHPTARLIGPVVIQEDATVEADAVIVGPSVIGAGARVRSHAVIAQSVVASGTVIPAFTVLNHRAVFSEQHRAAATAPFSLPSASDEAPASEIEVEPSDGHGVYPRVKGLIDRFIAGVILVGLAPVFALIAAIIKLDSRGNVFFGDLREGRGGQPFRCLKFRTMLEGSDLRQRELLASNEVDGPQFKLEKDPRLTRAGRWLRPMSLDELPQLINVLLGQMSLIGPRPSPFRENQTCVPWREARLSVKPGITGLWQVCRHDRGRGDFHQWIYFDLLYVHHMSLWVDLKIVMATVATRGGQNNMSVHRIINAPRLQA